MAESIMIISVPGIRPAIIFALGPLTTYAVAALIIPETRRMIAGSFRLSLPLISSAKNVSGLSNKPVTERFIPTSPVRWWNLLLLLK
jgi:hypothetical protein